MSWCSTSRPTISILKPSTCSKRLLAEFKGTLFLVSHDRAFLNRVVTSTIAFEGDGKVVEYVGGYDDWLRQRSQPETVVPARKLVREKPKKEGPRRLTFKERKELEELPGLIEALEKEQAVLHERMADPAFYREAGGKGGHGSKPSDGSRRGVGRDLRPLGRIGGGGKLITTKAELLAPPLWFGGKNFSRVFCLLICTTGRPSPRGKMVAVRAAGVVLSCWEKKSGRALKPHGFPITGVIILMKEDSEIRVYSEEYKLISIINNNLLAESSQRSFLMELIF